MVQSYQTYFLTRIFVWRRLFHYNYIHTNHIVLWRCFSVGEKYRKHSRFRFVVSIEPITHFRRKCFFWLPIYIHSITNFLTIMQYFYPFVRISVFTKFFVKCEVRLIVINSNNFRSFLGRSLVLSSTYIIIYS